MAWSVSNHEVIPDQEFLLPESTMHPYLWAFLKSDGDRFSEAEDGYATLREHLAVAVNRFGSRSVRGAISEQLCERITH